MAYDPVTGEWKPEDTGVEKRLTGLLSKDSDLMKQAATQGAQQANRRGLLNSTMGVQAGQTSRINAALPIASQEASQAHQSEMQGRGLQLQDIQQKRSIDANREFLSTEIGSREKMQGIDIGAQREFQQADLGSRERLQANELEGLNARLEQELGSRDRLQAAEIAAQKDRLGQQLSQQERIALQELQAAEARLGIEVGSRESMQQADIAFRETIAGLDREAQERIANMNVAAGERQNAASLAASYENSYSSIVANIMNNPEIPAAERQRYLNHAATVRDSNLRLVEQFYGIDLQWQGSGGTPGTGPATPIAPPPELLRDGLVDNFQPGRPGINARSLR